MGLGKTLTTLALIAGSAANIVPSEPSIDMAELLTNATLIVAPLSGKPAQVSLLHSLRICSSMIVANKI